MLVVQTSRLLLRIAVSRVSRMNPIATRRARIVPDFNTNLVSVSKVRLRMNAWPERLPASLVAKPGVQELPARSSACHHINQVLILLKRSVHEVVGRFPGVKRAVAPSSITIDSGLSTIATNDGQQLLVRLAHVIIDGVAATPFLLLQVN